MNLIDNFEVRIKDAFLEAMSSKHNQCRRTTGEVSNNKLSSSSMSHSERLDEMLLDNVGQGQLMKEEQMTRMEVLLRPEYERRTIEKLHRVVLESEDVSNSLNSMNEEFPVTAKSRPLVYPDLDF